MKANIEFIEALEQRRLFALLGVADQLQFPQITDVSVSTSLNYNHTTQLFSAVDFPLLFKSSPSDIGTRIFPSTTVTPARISDVEIRVDNTGQFDASNPSGPDLLVTGKITLGSSTYDGVLLQGIASPFGAFGFAPTSAGFDFRFTPTGGLLLALPQFSGKDIGLTLTAEANPTDPASNPYTGSFQVDFNGLPKGFIGPIPKPSGVVGGLTATIGFWHNKNGQALIKSFNGGSTATLLSGWLATSFPHLYGAGAGSNNLTGKTNAEVAAFFLKLFNVTGQKLDAQVLAVALGVYSTTSGLGGTVAGQYGFSVSGAGLFSSTFNVGSSGAAFGVANGATLSIFQILQEADAQAVNGVLYNGNTALRNLANSVFDGINEKGDI